MTRLISIVLSILLATAVSAQDVNDHLTRAIGAYEKKDYATYLDEMRKASALRPNHPRIIYNLASAEALNGHGPAAIQGLNRLAAMGLAMEAQKDSDFASLASDPGFLTVTARLARNGEPAGAATVAFTMPDKGIVAEGVAYDARRKTFYVSSVHNRRIYAVDSAGHARVFAEKLDLLWGAFGIAIDAKHRSLWVATSLMPQVEGTTKEEDGRAAVVRFDLDTGKLTAAYPVAADGKKHAIGDLAVAPNGDVYATDGKTPAIYRIGFRGAKLVPWLASPEFASPQGIVVTPKGDRIYMVDYARGVFSIDPKSKQVRAVVGSPDDYLLGLDGLAWHEGSLLATQNATPPHRVIRLVLDRAGSGFERIDVLASALPEFDEPTLGTVAGNDFVFVASSGWRTIGEDGKLAPDSELRAPVLMRTRLPKR